MGGAAPLRVGGPPSARPAGPALPALDRQVLGLLLAGLTDRSIASQLGLSMRTVQRRVQGRMELAGVRTRLQLG
jgi:DNA-binding NarL/FixJ family response regulator